MFNPYISREKVLQYCLDQGTGIEYDKTPHNETTIKENHEADHEERKQRYVNTATVNILWGWHRPEQIAYAVKNNMDLCDFDDWQALQDLLGIAMPYSIEKEIEAIMIREVPDLRPLEIEPEPEFRAAIKNKYARSNNLSADDAIAYAFYQNIDHKVALKISQLIWHKLGIDIAVLTRSRIAALLNE